MATYSLHSGPHDNYKLHPTFQSACAARGLLEGDDEWDQCLEEAGLIHTGHQLRQLFASILLHNNPLNPRLLYERHLPCLSDDCRYRLQTRFHVFNLGYEQIESLALHEIDIILQQSGKSLTDYHLPIPTIDFNSLSSVPRIIAEEKADNPRELLDLWTVGYRSANVEQKVIPIQFNLPLHLNAVDCSSSMDLVAPGRHL